MSNKTLAARRLAHSSPFMSSPHHAFISSTLPMGQNFAKNVIFRGSTIVLSFVVARVFGFVAFKRRDYASYVMSGEDIFQKGFFVSSRKYNAQALLVTAFTVMMLATGLYDTMLWALDSPGYITKTTRMNAAQFLTQMLDSPGYLISLSNPHNNLSLINLNDTFGANLYIPGLNFTIPGTVTPSAPQTVPQVIPLSVSVPPSIWLDSEGWAVGPDNTIMMTADMNTTTACAAENVQSNGQAWRCPIDNSDALALFDKSFGFPQIWWDVNTSEFLVPSRKDNPWQSLGSGSDTAMMKQVFTLTKGTRRHTFSQTTLKAVMLSQAPALLDNTEITDFMRKVWTTTPPGGLLPPAAQTLVDLVIQAKNNQTSLTFGSLFNTANTSVTSYSTDYLNVQVNGSNYYTSLRFASTTIKLIRSEDIPEPIATCNDPYSNFATGGIVHSVNCYSSYLFNASDQSQSSGRFLGQIDASSVLILSDILGDGTRSTSDSALDPIGMAWYLNNTDHIDQLLLSRGLILGGVREDVEVDVQHNEAAISYLQLLLTLFPLFLLAVVVAITLRQPMSYYTNSFFAAVCSTTHLTEGSCEKLGYIHFPPDIVLRSTAAHVVLSTSDGRVLAVDEDRTADCPLPLDQEPLFSTSEGHQSSAKEVAEPAELGSGPHSISFHHTPSKAPDESLSHDSVRHNLAGSQVI